MSATAARVRARIAAPGIKKCSASILTAITVVKLNPASSGAATSPTDLIHSSSPRWSPGYQGLAYRRLECLSMPSLSIGCLSQVFEFLASGSEALCQTRPERTAKARYLELSREHTRSSDCRVSRFARGVSSDAAYGLGTT